MSIFYDHSFTFKSDTVQQRQILLQKIQDIILEHNYTLCRQSILSARRIMLMRQVQVFVTPSL